MEPNLYSGHAELTKRLAGLCRSSAKRAVIVRWSPDRSKQREIGGTPVQIAARAIACAITVVAGTRRE
jgi:hypothetical protein